MKRKRLFLLLGLEAVLLLALVLLADRLPALFSSLIAFPFEQLGLGLRALSMTGRLGNGLALALWAGVSLLPLIPVWRRRDDGTDQWERSALVILAAVLFFVLLGMADPVMLYRSFPGMSDVLLPVLRAIMGATVWSVAVLWAVLRLLRLFRAGDRPALLGYMRWLLYALCVLFTGVIALSAGSTLIALREAAGGVMTVLRFLVDALPYCLDIAVTLAALGLLDALGSDDPAAGEAAAEKLSRLCCLSLALTVAAVAALNVLQLALAQWLTDIAATVSIPLMSIAFVLAVLLSARLIAENRRLRGDNDLFI